MYYCMRCGDPIDKDEVVCDKCGVKFKIVKEDGATLYVNMSPVPKAENPKVNKNKKKKKKKGWLIALLSVGGVLGLLLIGVVIVLTIAVVGVVSLVDDLYNSGINVYNPAVEEDANVTALAETPIVFDNLNNNNTNESLTEALREPFVNVKGDGKDTVTVMIYMNGSDLESQYGYASNDLREILNATLSENVNVVIQTGGTKKWKTDSISNTHSQRFVVRNGQLVLADDSLDQLDITKEESLEGFIDFCNTNYPADRNMLILWNHGGGVVYGYGVDENVADTEASLTLDEIQQAVRNSQVKFEMIGFDACLMGGLETACSLCDVADYLIVSEDFESGEGWEYQNWLTLLGYNSSTSMTDIGKVIVDDFIKESIVSDSDGVLALVDLRYSGVLYNSWKDFAYANKADLLQYDYSMSMERNERSPHYIFKSGKKGFWDWFYEDDYTMETYCYAVDLMAVASKMDTEESKALASALANAILYCSTTQGDSYMTGLSVTLPYSDSEFYGIMTDVFNKCGFDEEYISFLAEFVDADFEGSYNWEESGYSGWEDFDYDEYYYDWEDFLFDNLWYDDFYGYYDEESWYSDSEDYYGNDGYWDYFSDEY